MAISLIQGDNIKYTGLSSDTKPTSGILAGTVFYESDTSRKYMYSGSSWFELINNQVDSDGSELANSFDNGSKTVTTSSGELFAVNADRVFLSLTNDDEYDVWISFAETAVVGEGMKLGSYGGIISFTKENIPKGVINAIADGGSADIAYVEGE